jgi:vacuolar-type H+-ATPase subunit E/Vma4
MEDLLRKLVLLKTNPKLIDSLPQGDIIKMMETLVTAFRALQKAIEANKLKGDDGITPIPGKDYQTKREAEEMLSSVLEKELNRFEKKVTTLEKAIEKRLERLRDGKDAEVSTTQIQQAAQIASKLIELPDFSTLITTEPTAIRDALELLQGDERLTKDAIKGLDELEKNLRTEIASVPRDGGVVKRLKFLNDVDTTAANENATLQYRTATGKWLTGVSITVSATAPTDPKYGDLWIALPA